MKFKLIILVLCSALCLTAYSSATAQEKSTKKKKKSKHIVIHSDEPIHIHELEDLTHLDIELGSLGECMHDLDIEMGHLSHELKNLSHLEHLEFMHIPEIHIDMQDFDFDFDFDFNFDFDFDFDSDNFTFEYEDFSDSEFKDISDKDAIRIRALHSLSHKNEDKAIPVIKKTINKNSNPAVRYHAVRCLRSFLDNKQILPILEDVAKNDKNIKVRKMAIYLLGKDGSPKAVDILNDLVRK